MTPSKLSRQTKIDTANLSRYKSGQCNPSLKNIGKTAKALGIDAADIIE